MNALIAQFINEHEDEIDTNDFFSLFTSAHNELSNHDCEELFIDLIEVFDTDWVMKQREAAFRFILTYACDDLDPSHSYTFRDLASELGNNFIGYDFDTFCEYVRQNQAEFDIEVYSIGPGRYEKIKKVGT